mgnify:CR=1 FL=1
MGCAFVPAAVPARGRHGLTARQTPTVRPRQAWAGGQPLAAPAHGGRLQATCREAAVMVATADEAAAAPQDADAVGAMEAAARRLRAEAADGCAARWDFDVRHGRPVEAPAVWRWSPVEA